VDSKSTPARVVVSAWTVEQYGGGLCVEQATREGNIALCFEMVVDCAWSRPREGNIALRFEMNLLCF
jgi:hypothetical protein